MAAARGLMLSLAGVSVALIRAFHIPLDPLGLALGHVDGAVNLTKAGRS